MSTTGNLATVIEMDQKHFPRPWKERDWLELDWAHHFLKLHSKENKIIGFALFAYVAGDDVAHLLKICVLPEYRGKGEAISFWQELLPELRSRGASSVFLEVEGSNLRAQSFYKKMGFAELRTIKGYYSDGENALVMLMKL